MPTGEAHPGISPPAEPTSGPRGSAIGAAIADIKLAHTVFALPFAVLAAFLVAPRGLDSGGILWPTFAGQLGVVVVCMVFARTWAMVVNRLADHRFDRDNPRTARRAIPAGRLGVRQGWMVALGAAALFWTSAGLFWVFYGNPWPAVLAVPVLGWIALYSYTKRFTMLCHLFLGSALAVSPIAAAIAVGGMDVFLGGGTSTNAQGVPAVTLWVPRAGASILLVALFVMLWVAGFDVAYALQDLDFDKRVGLRSIPARFGVRGALWVSRGLHLLAFAALVMVARGGEFGPAFTVATIAVGALLVFEHTVLARRGIAGLPMAFFTVNGIISVTVALAGVADILMRSHPAPPYP